MKIKKKIPIWKLTVIYGIPNGSKTLFERLYAMDPITPRQLEIIQVARKTGRVRVNSLADDFQVTPQTVRKDLADLCERGLLQRVHGGAVIASSVSNYGYEARRELAADGKRRIGLKAASLISNNSSVIINIGTTTEQVAKFLQNKHGLLVITNNINVINTLYANPEIETIIAGGLVRHADGGVVGEATIDFIRQFKVDYAIIGASGIDRDGSLMDFDYREVKVARAIIENARHSILVADSLKYDRSAPVRITNISQIGSFVTDEAPPDSILRICEENDVRVEIADNP